MKLAKVIRNAGVFLAVSVFGLSVALALEPPTRAMLKKYRADGTWALRVAQAKAMGNHLVSKEMAASLQYRLKEAALEAQGWSPEAVARTIGAPPRIDSLPAKGPVKILILLIAFKDYPFQTPKQDLQAKLFGNGTGGQGFPYESLRNFYLRSSYNQLTIGGSVLGWYTTSYARNKVKQTAAGREVLIKEALNYYNKQGHNFAQYDNDGDGTIDNLSVFWTGPHGEWASFWWGYNTWWSDSAYLLDGKSLGNYSWQWELHGYPSGTFTPFVMIHETGHALGLPDYYDYDGTVGPDGGVGGFDIMDGSGDNNCFSKFLLGWLKPIVASSSGRTVRLRPSGTTKDAFLFMPDAAAGNCYGEFFMVQNRFRAANDSQNFLQADGLAVWHVDSRLNEYGWFRFNNSFTKHKLLRLMEADGLEEIEKNWGADGGDLYVQGRVFGPASKPNSRRYDGSQTWLGIRTISLPTPLISFEFFKQK